jgi:hypothetical protein
MRWKPTGWDAWLLAVGVLTPACKGPLEPSDLVGTWGGAHVEVAFDSAGFGTVQYDCAHGRIAPPITLSAAGALRASGEHVREHGGPVHEGEVPDTHPAQYAGEVHGDRLTFTVTLTDSASVLGPYTVRRGEPAQLFRCL